MNDKLKFISLSRKIVHEKKKFKKSKKLKE